MMVHPIIEKICKYVYLFIMSTRLRKRTTAVWTRKTTQIYLLSSGLKPIDPMCMIFLNKSKTPRDSYWKHILYPIILKKTTFCQFRRVHRTPTHPPPTTLCYVNNVRKVFKAHKIEHFSGERRGVIRHVECHETFNLLFSSQLYFIDWDYAHFSWRECYSRILSLDLQSELFSLIAWSKRTKAKWFCFIKWFDNVNCSNFGE